jgi:hypothetical protein
MAVDPYVEQAEGFVTRLSEHIHLHLVQPMIDELAAENGGAAAVRLYAIEFNLVHPDGSVYEYVYMNSDCDLGGYVEQEAAPAGGGFKIKDATVTLWVEGDVSQKGYEVDCVIQEGDSGDDQDSAGPIVATHIQRDIFKASEIDVAQFQKK